MREELKPCPFCGSDHVEDTMRTGAIVCQNCGASAPRWQDWNRRAPTPDPALRTEARGEHG